MRQTAVQQIGGYNPEFDVTEDFDLFLRLGEVGKLANLPKVLMKYREHFKGVNLNNRIRQQEQVKLIVLKALQKRNIDAIPQKVFSEPKNCSAEQKRIQWINQSLNHGYYPTALKHTFLLLITKPLSFKIWKLLLKGLIFQLSSMRSHKFIRSFDKFHYS
jgi:hypothetical protein